MAGRFLGNLKKIKTEVVKDNSVPKGTLVVKLHDEDIDNISTIEPDDAMRQFMSGASKLAITAASIECAFKAAAAMESAEREGLDITAEKIKTKLNVSSTDDSWSHVRESLTDLRQEVLAQQEELRELENLYYGTATETKGKDDDKSETSKEEEADSSDDSDSSDESD